MKIMIIRHADPDYSIDSLTPTGHIEAELLSRKLENTKIDAFYLSPLGRAKDTAEYTLKKLGRTAETCDWLREFPPRICRPDRQNTVCWDWLPQDWTVRDAFYSHKRWADEPEMVAAGVKDAYNRVSAGLDELLARHGYTRNGRFYKAEKPNEDTIALFCHFGLECVLLSHLLGISPMPLWHGFCAAPSSVTTLVTEERREGAASFRVLSFGDTTHLSSEGYEPSFSARFCETYDRADQRHD